MYKKILFPCILFLLLAAAAGPQVVSAGVDPLASPTPRPTERVTAPVISGVNPDAVLSEGILEESIPSGSFVPVGISLPVQVDPPQYVELKSLPSTQDQSNLPRNISDINCGPAALARALRILDPEGQNLPPTTTQLSHFMSSRGLIYEWGTGVEELAYTARKNGYEGSVPFHNWSIDQLINSLHGGKPIVVSLGMNGADKPGHFVTLTGVSGDRKWITYQDPTTGESILSREELQHLWQLQGSAGVIPQKKTSINNADPLLPWMGLFGAISAMALTLNQSAGLRESLAFSLLRKQLANPRRKGIGAGPLPPKEPEVNQVPRYETKTVYRGIKTIEVDIPEYQTRKVKVGIREIKKEVPQYETRRVKVGIEKVTKRVPVYSTKKVQSGTKLVMKKIPVTRYRNKKEMVRKKFTSRVPVYQYIGSKRIVIGYKDETRWKLVQVTRKVPYQTTKTISVQVPVYEKKKVISGYKVVTQKRPKFKQKQVLVGHKIIKETIPVFEERQVQIGTKTVTRQMPDYETVRVPIIDEKDQPKNANDSESSSPPTGLSAEIWNSFSAEDQMKIRAKGISWAEEQKKINAARENWIYKTYLHGQDIKTKISDFLKNIGLPVTSSEPNNLVSLSVYKDLDINLFSENGVVIDSFTPPNILNLLYMEQSLSIKPKVVVTAFPGDLIDLNISSRKGTIKLGDFSLFGTLNGEVGFSTKQESTVSEFDDIQNKHSVKISINGISYNMIKEGITNLDNNANNQVDIKKIVTLKSHSRTVKILGIVLMIGMVVIIGGLLHLLSSTGSLIPVFS